MPSFATRACLTSIAGVVSVVALHGGTYRPVDIPDRIRGAERVVVAEVAHVESRYQRTRFGDELIVSRVRLRPSETLKGTPAATLTLEVEGGSVDGVTLRVSDLEPLEVGERAVFFLARGQADLHVPHLRGQGILKLDDMDRVRGTSLTLDMIRQMAQAAGR
jgi:hypothetical protein